MGVAIPAPEDLRMQLAEMHRILDIIQVPGTSLIGCSLNPFLRQRCVRELRINDYRAWFDDLLGNHESRIWATDVCTKCLEACNRLACSAACPAQVYVCDDACAMIFLRACIK